MSLNSILLYNRKAIDYVSSRLAVLFVRPSSILTFRYQPLYLTSYIGRCNVTIKGIDYLTSLVKTHPAIIPAISFTATSTLFFFFFFGSPAETFPCEYRKEYRLITWFSSEFYFASATICQTQFKIEDEPKSIIFKYYVNSWTDDRMELKFSTHLWKLLEMWRQIKNTKSFKI